MTNVLNKNPLSASLKQTENSIAIAVRESTNLTNYEPEKGLKKIAVAEAAENYYRRAKNPEKLVEAITAKRTEQRDFVLWWDKQSKQHGQLGNRDVTQFAQLKDLQLDKATVFRWRASLGTPEKYKAQIALDTVRAEKWCVGKAPHQAANFSSETNQWYTPEIYLNAVRAVLGEIDLDPASSEVANKTVGAAEIFDQDGLRHLWHGRVFLNPPYGTENGDSVAGQFCNKAIAEYQAGRVSEVIILVNSSHSQKWQRPLYDFAVCLVNHRIKFLSPDGKENPNPTFQNVFIYCGPNKKAFASAFSIFGYVMEKISLDDRRNQTTAVSSDEGRRQ